MDVLIYFCIEMWHVVSKERLSKLRLADVSSWNISGRFFLSRDRFQKSLGGQSTDRPEVRVITARNIKYISTETT
jgi:hypothetical protein